MKKAPNLFKIPGDFLVVGRNGGSMAEIDGEWLQARPLGFYSLWWRIKLAWMVFTGAADAVKWKGQ